MNRVKSIRRVTPQERVSNIATRRAWVRSDSKWQSIEPKVLEIEAEWQLPELSGASHDPVLDRSGESYDGEKADSTIGRQRWAREIRAAAFAANGAKIAGEGRSRLNAGWWMANGYRLQTLGE